MAIQRQTGKGFTPTSASWLNAVEGLFAKLTRQRLKRGVFKGIVDLQAAINRFLADGFPMIAKPYRSADPAMRIREIPDAVPGAAGSRGAP